jgi:hypothetical protein
MKVGDRVVAKNGVFNGLVIAFPATGTIVHIGKSLRYPNRDRIGVEFDDPVLDGHSCSGRGKSGHCRWGYIEELSIYEELQPPKEFFYKSRKLSYFLSRFNQNLEVVL